MAGEPTQKGQCKSNGSKSVMCEIRLHFKDEGKKKGLARGEAGKKAKEETR